MTAGSDRKMKMTGEERRKKIIEILKKSDGAVPGSRLADELKVSRQSIVTDIAILRAGNAGLISTNSGYMLERQDDRQKATRIFKVSHTDEQLEDELTCITDLGGAVLDVFVQHKVYGTISAPLNISSKRDIQNFLADLKSGVSTPLKNITNNFHYHTVEAKSESVLDEIESALREKGYLLDAKDTATVYEAKNYSLV